MTLSSKDFQGLLLAADAADAQRELMASMKSQSSGGIPARRLAGPVVIAVALLAAVAVLSIVEFIPEQQQTSTYMSELQVRSPAAGG